MSGSVGEVEHRCRDGAGCVEVTARVAAAELIRREFGDDRAADQLLATAQRFAELHNYGTERVSDQVGA